MTPSMGVPKCEQLSCQWFLEKHFQHEGSRTLCSGFRFTNLSLCLAPLSPQSDLPVHCFCVPHHYLGFATGIFNQCKTSTYWNRNPERWWDFHPWEYSKVAWTGPWESWSHPFWVKLFCKLIIRSSEGGDPSIMVCLYPTWNGEAASWDQSLTILISVLAWKRQNLLGQQQLYNSFGWLKKNHRTWCIQTSASGAERGTKELISTSEELSSPPKAALTAPRASPFESRCLVLLAGTCKCSSLCLKNCFSGFEES